MTIAVPRQDEIHVSVDTDGVIFISQETDDPQFPDLIAVLPQNVEALIRALRAAKHRAQEAV